MDIRKVVLVTGASSGLGKATASLLSRNGHRVFGTSRKAIRSREFEVLRLDVTSAASVKSCISALMKKSGRIDVLINNAGSMMLGSLEETSIAEARQQFETNFFGPISMVNAVLPIMRKQGTGLIINISSLAATFPVPFQSLYAQTKVALLSYSEALRHELRSFNIHVSVVEPGFFGTELFNNARTVKKPILQYARQKNHIYSWLKREAKTGQDPELVAKAILKIIKEPKPRLRYPVGREKNYLIVKRILPNDVLESGMRAHFGLD